MKETGRKETYNPEDLGVDASFLPKSPTQAGPRSALRQR